MLAVFKNMLGLGTHNITAHADCAMHAPPGMTVAKCGNVFTEYDRDPRIFDNTTDMELIFYDIVNFNNIASSGLTVF